MYPSQEDLDADIEVKLKKDIVVEAVQYYLTEQYQ